MSKDVGEEHQNKNKHSIKEPLEYRTQHTANCFTTGLSVLDLADMAAIALPNHTICT